MLTSSSLAALLAFVSIAGWRAPRWLWIPVLFIGFLIAYIEAWKQQRLRWREEQKRCETLQVEANERCNALLSEADEIYADIVLAWLKEHFHATGFVSPEHLVKDLNLSQEKIERGFAVLEKLQLLTRLPVGWKFTASDAIRAIPKFKTAAPQ
ncbi:MAG TPA: hypothetical protein VJN64_11690 [Terriglobales bacterium]|nr:hypothetical protein [Terriglobales bacterium]